MHITISGFENPKNGQFYKLPAKSIQAQENLLTQLKNILESETYIKKYGKKN